VAVTLELIFTDKCFKRFIRSWVIKSVYLMFLL